MPLPHGTSSTTTPQFGHATRRIAYTKYDISSIERVGRSGARVLLRNGDEVVLRDSNDVDDGNRGISVSDLDMGQALLDWDEFDRVEFHPIVVTDYSGFDGGQRLHGTVVTESGEELTGEISWDNDENFTWEMLNGDSKGVDFQIEFSRIESIVNLGDGARVLLKDGRSYSLYDSNDVDDGNRGITIRTGGRDVEVEWEEFAEMRIH